MKEYIKTFLTPEDADQYKIVDIPWMGFVDSTLQNLVCNLANKQCRKEGDLLIIDDISIPYNEIWYTTTDEQIYDLGGIIEMIVKMGGTYNGPAVVSNEYDEEKQMYCLTFDGNVTALGAANLETMTFDGPMFATVPEYQVECNVETIILPKTINKIGSYAFANCSGLTSIEIPNNVTRIGDRTFWGCSGLTSVTIPNSVTSIGKQAFSHCTSLTSIIIPSGVIIIENSAFSHCASLTSIEIPNSVTSIGKQAFSHCTSLTSVTIGNSVTSIGENAFENCASLTFIICEAATPPALESDAFFETNNCPIYVPSQSVDAYKTSWSDYADRIVGLLNNNQIRYTASSQLTINDGVDYTEHTFDNGVGIVTFTNDLTTLEESWFGNTFDNYIDNITSLTLPNGVSSIERAALSGVNTVYYEGTQKECAKIDKNLADGTGVDEYQCFDGVVNEYYVPDRINSIPLRAATWLKNLIGENALLYLIATISSYKIDEHPMTASEFITMLVNGVDGNPGLSAYGFTVVNQEILGVTTPLAQHTESGHFIAILKATDYARIDLEHIARVAVNESLDPDYMYILLELGDTPEPSMVDVTIEHEDGSSESVSLDSNLTYAEQGYTGYYSQNTYDSSMGETPDQFLVDGLFFPTGGVTICDYCNDIMIDITIYIESGEPESVKLRRDMSFRNQGYEGYYISDTYDSGVGETPETYSADNRYPGEDISSDPTDPITITSIYNYCNDTYEPEPTYVDVTIEHEDGSSESVSLDSNLTYAEQGYTGYYSQNTYDSSIEPAETPDQFLVDGLFPTGGVTIYDYCNPA